MTKGITKTKTGSYRVRITVPVSKQKYFQTKRIEKHFKTLKEAKIYYAEMYAKVNNISDEDIKNINRKTDEILFSDFYKNVWWEPYKAGQTTANSQPPSAVTINNTKTVFRIHILPLFGEFSIKFLNQNKELVLKLLTQKADEYVNFKVIKSYMNSIFDWAVELEYIETNKLSKTIKRIKSTKKIMLQNQKQDEDLYLSNQELSSWLDAVNQDFQNHKLDLKDYTLFYTTFLLSARKSEIYALQWKHIDLKNNTIHIEQVLDKFGEVKTTKGKKKTTSPLKKATPHKLRHTVQR